MIIYPEAPRAFKMTLPQADLEAFDGRVQAQHGQSLEAIAAQDPFGAYALIIGESITRQDVNGLTFSPDSLVKPGPFDPNPLVARQLKRRVPDPSDQPVNVELRGWRVGEWRHLRRRGAISYKVLSFCVRPSDVAA